MRAVVPGIRHHFWAIWEPSGQMAWLERASLYHPYSPPSQWGIQRIGTECARLPPVCREKDPTQPPSDSQGPPWRVVGTPLIIKCPLTTFVSISLNLYSKVRYIWGKLDSLIQQIAPASSSNALTTTPADYIHCCCCCWWCFWWWWWWWWCCCDGAW
jgi:hypothetical protein